MNIGDVTSLVTQVTDAIDRHTRAIHARTLYLVESNDTDRGRQMRDDWRERIEGELRKVSPTSPKKEKPHVKVSALSAPLQCSVDDGYLDALDSPPTQLQCEICGRIYEYSSGKMIG